MARSRGGEQERRHCETHECCNQLNVSTLRRIFSIVLCICQIRNSLPPRQKGRVLHICCGGRFAKTNFHQQPAQHF
uniref:Uncharacterized protein n=1 Tax=Anopheles arabiensis TaxID=7173 RepID=A0A8W7MTS9_ANOAR